MHLYANKEFAIDYYLCIIKKQTDGNGVYIFTDVEEGNYNLLFSYDPNITEITNNFLNAYIHLDFIPKATLMNTYEGDTTSFRSVKDRVRNITFQDEINIPEDVDTKESSVEIVLKEKLT